MLKGYIRRVNSRLKTHVESDQFPLPRKAALIGPRSVPPPPFSGKALGCDSLLTHETSIWPLAVVVAAVVVRVAR